MATTLCAGHMGKRAAQGLEGKMIPDIFIEIQTSNGSHFCFRLAFQIVDGAVKIYKGTNPEVDSYSVFWDNKKLSDTSLNSQLKEKGITDIYVCGLAYDVCVG